MQLQHSPFLHREDDVIQESAGENWEKEPMGGTFPKDPQLLSIPDAKMTLESFWEKEQCSIVLEEALEVCHQISSDWESMWGVFQVRAVNNFIHCP